MEISDSEDNFHFMVNGLMQVKDYDPIYIHTRKVVKSSRNDVRKMIENAAKDPETALKNAMPNISPKNGNLPSIAPKSYNPIEME